MDAGGFVKNVIAIGGISLGILVFAEGSMRILFPEKVGDANIFDSLAYEFNEGALISLKPNISKEFVRKEENGGYITRWSTNDDSFRGASLRSKPGHRVMVYGDSNIQARFSGDARTYTGQLARLLRENGIPDVDVINAGVVGSGPDQSLIRFMEHADIYNPDLVIFHVFADNDFGDIIRNRLFDLDENGGLSKVVHETTEDKYLIVSERKKRKAFISQLLIVRAIYDLVAPPAENQSVEGNVDLVEEVALQVDTVERDRLFDLLQRFTEEEYSVYKESGPRKFSVFNDHYDLDIAIDPDRESSRTKLRLMEAVLKEASALAKRKGIDFLVVIQPSVIDLTKENFGLGYDYFQKFPKYRRSNLTDAVENICVSNGIYSVNLFDLFMDNNPEDLFFRAGNDHWNDLGQKLAAEATVGHIREKSLIKPEDEPKADSR